jgi:hypothetical protein
MSKAVSVDPTGGKFNENGLGGRAMDPSKKYRRSPY